MKRMIKIPLAYQIVADDVGWFRGDDERWNNGPSRTGMPRKHVAEDYLVLNELGKAIDMKINCPLVLGEWDKDNVLRGMEHATNNPEGWDMSSEIDYDVAEKCFEAAEGSDFIEYSLHGVMHGYWNGGNHIADQEYYIPPNFDYKTRYSSELVPVSKEYFESHLDAFFKIYNSWGFKKKIRSFTSPSGCYGNPEQSLCFADALKDRGIIYWANNWRDITEIARVLNGVTFVNKSRGNGIPWNAYDIDPSVLPDFDASYFDGEFMPERTIFSVHWPNFLRFNPQDNFEKIPQWIKFFKRQSEIFGVMISKDIKFCAEQALYRRFTKITFGDKKITLDFTDVDTCGALGRGNTLYLSVRNGLSANGCQGGVLTEYETHNLFKTYKIERSGDKIAEITFR